jgi:hypothetical protein
MDNYRWVGWGISFNPNPRIANYEGRKRAFFELLTSWQVPARSSQTRVPHHSKGGDHANLTLAERVDNPIEESASSNIQFPWITSILTDFEIVDQNTCVTLWS